MHEAATAEQIAVIGMACRLPRASDPEGFWALLREGVDAVGEVPAGRWPQGTAAGYRRGGFLDQVDRFDAGFFGISPHEAAAMDPQQRLMLELAWEACEHARIAPDRLRGSDTGVFVGAIAADYAALVDRHGAAALSSHTLAGVQRGIIANRISYVLGLRGRSMTVDTGQSSSLAAVQSACEDLRRGDSRIALAGGVNLNLLPETTETISRFGALSPDGRCYTFDERANGYVRGEGGALLVLKPLSDALADGDTVHCVILGGAINNDGGGTGLTVPDADAQREVIRSAWRRAGVGASEVQYVELHGTGTAVGDPIEAAALGGAMTEAEGRDGADPLLVGSVKTNIGHLEGAAGIAGLLKVVLSLAHRELAPSLNFTTASPRIPLAELDARRRARHARLAASGAAAGGRGQLLRHGRHQLPPGARRGASTRRRSGGRAGSRSSHPGRRGALSSLCRRTKGAGAQPLRPPGAQCGHRHRRRGALPDPHPDSLRAPCRAPRYRAHRPEVRPRRARAEPARPRGRHRTRGLGRGRTCLPRPGLAVGRHGSRLARWQLPGVRAAPGRVCASARTASRLCAAGCAA